MAKFTEARLQKVLKDLRAGVQDAGDIDDCMAFDIADSILFEEIGMEEYIREVKGYSDPQGFVANSIY